MGMCRRVGSHFHDWIDYNGVALSTEFLTELLEWGRKLSGFWEEKRWLVGCKSNAAEMFLLQMESKLFFI